MAGYTRAELQGLLEDAKVRFASARTVLSFDEYVELFAADPERYGRDASGFLKAAFDFYGTEAVSRPYGQETRWKLFDLPWEDEAGKRESLAGHEGLQREFYRALSNFVRQGRTDRMLLLHGPNGSAKSTFVACLMRAMEDFSRRDEGALYRFHWVFPRGKGTDRSIGFGSTKETVEGPKPGESYALLDEVQLDAKIISEVRDHPLLVLPLEIRRKLLLKLYGEEKKVPAFLWRGGLSHKFQQVFDALWTAYRGELSKVLAHVQVERWYVSRRYRSGAVTLGPQMAVDAKERQVTASRSLSALPASLQNVTLFEPFGDLVDAAGGILEYSDLLKRPLEAWKYLLLMIETGEIALTTANLMPNLVLVGSSNEGHLDAFREHPEYPSFRGRLELVRAPYLLDWKEEKRIYDRQVLPGVLRHVAPHATELAALFAVLSRMKKPASDRFPRALAALVGELTPMEKAELYASAAVPQRMTAEQSKELRAGIDALYRESDTYPNYEGRAGASPREMRVLLLDAAQHPNFHCLSPFAVLEELSKLATRKSEFEWLRQDPLAGGFHDPRYFLKTLRERLLDVLEEELRDATGLIEEGRPLETFERYVAHVNMWVKGEKLRNRVTGRDEDPDESMMRELEKTFGATVPPAEFRRNLISAVAAYAIDHPGEVVDQQKLFPKYLQKLKQAFFSDQRKVIISIAQHVLLMVAGEGTALEEEQKKRAKTTLAGLAARGYCDACARDACAALLKDRFIETRT